MKPPNYTSLPDRYWSKVDEPNENGCWEWNASTTSGYGQFRINRTTRVATHLSFADAGGVKGDLLMLHHCDNPPCVNPAHLYPGNRFDNARDRMERNPDSFLKGEAVKHSNLTAEKVKSLRSDYETGDYSICSPVLAKKYGVSTSAVWKVLTGRSWRSLTW